MRKFAKIISIALILVSLLGVCSGCMRSEVMTTLYFGVPFEKDSEHWNALQLAVEDINMFKDMNSVWDAWVSQDNEPARLCVEAALASPAFLVEISVTAAVIR